MQLRPTFSRSGSVLASEQQGARITLAPVPLYQLVSALRPRLFSKLGQKCTKRVCLALHLFNNPTFPFLTADVAELGKVNAKAVHFLIAR